MDVQHRRVSAGRQNHSAFAAGIRCSPGPDAGTRPDFSRTELCERIWHRDHEYDTRTVEIFITRLRKKLDARFPTHLIHTYRSSGYSIRRRL